MPQNKWSRDELVVAFNLYCRTPFGRLHKNNADVVKLAQAISRSPSAVAWKLVNFASLDPSVTETGRVGATHGSKGDLEVWEEFSQDWDRLAVESELLLAQIEGNPLPTVLTPEEAVTLPEGKVREAIVKVRIGQSFFRASVLAAYDFRCCISGLSVPELLNASHIVPWSKDAAQRTNPSNGLCLNAVLDRAYDRGLLTVMPDLSIKLSRTLIAKKDDAAFASLLTQYEGAKITLPQRFAPDPIFLQWHNENVFHKKSA